MISIIAIGDTSVLYMGKIVDHGYPLNSGEDRTSVEVVFKARPACTNVPLLTRNQQWALFQLKNSPFPIPQ